MEDPWNQASDIKLMFKTSMDGILDYIVDVTISVDQLEPNNKLSATDRHGHRAVLNGMMATTITKFMEPLLGTRGETWQLVAISDDVSATPEHNQLIMTIRFMDSNKALLTKLAWDATTIIG